MSEKSELKFDDLRRWVFDEAREVTKMFVRRRTTSNSKEIERIFQEFLKKHANHDPPVHATFVVLGDSTNDAGLPVRLSLMCPAGNLEAVKKKFGKVSSVTIYALHQAEKTPIRPLLDADWSLDGLPEGLPQVVVKREPKIYINPNPTANSGVKKPTKRAAKAKTAPKKAEPKYKVAKPRVAKIKVKMEDLPTLEDARQLFKSEDSMDSNIFTTGADEESIGEPKGEPMDVSEPANSSSEKELENVVPAKRGSQTESTGETSKPKIFKRVHENYVDEDGMHAIRQVVKEVEAEVESPPKKKKLSAPPLPMKSGKKAKETKLPKNQPKLTAFFSKQ